MCIALEELEADKKNIKKPVRLIISSVGGDVIAANSMWGRLTLSPLIINTYGLGNVESAAVLLLQFGARRYLSNHAFLMIHKSSCGVQGKIAKCKAELAFQETLDQMIDKTIATRIGMPFEKYLELENETERYIFANEALELNFIDELF
jgi:ATP-dependent protease ClpP protease subunit